MKAPLKPRRPSPEEALAIVSQAAPLQPPAQIAAPAASSEADTRTTLNLRMRHSTISAIEAVAKERGLTLKLVVTQALQAAGVHVAQADLEDRTPKRKT